MKLRRTVAPVFVLAAALVLGAVTPLTVSSPAFAASSGKNGRIAYERDGDIYTVRPDGTRVRRVTFNKDSHDPAWGPGGYRMLYRRNGHIWIMGAAGRHKAPLGLAGSAPSWAPTARRFVYSTYTGQPGSTGGRLMIYTFATKKSVPITPPPGTDPQFPLGAVQPAWSPHGNEIVFGNWQPGTSDSPEQIDIWLIRPDGSDARPLPTIERGGTEPTWSPDASRIAFLLTAISRGGPSWSVFLGIARPDSPQRPQRLRDGAYGADSVAWAPGGHWIVTTHPYPCPVDSSACEAPGLWLLHPDGSGVHRILGGRSNWVGVDWQRVPGS